MLKNCTALIVADNSQKRWRLEDLVAAADFGEIRAFSNVPIIAQTMDLQTLLCLIDGKCEDDKIRETLEEVRECSEVDVSMMPMILLGGPYTDIEVKRYIKMGLDDIVSLPMDSHPLRQRLLGQFDCRIEYFRTDTYFGPDRRRGIGLSGSRVQTGTGYQKVTFARKPGAGVRLLSIDVHRAKVEPAVAQPTTTALAVDFETC